MAQAAGTADAGGGSVLQNPKVLVGLIVVVAIAVIILIWQMLPKDTGGGVPTAPAASVAAPGDAQQAPSPPGGSAPAAAPALTPATPGASAVPTAGAPGATPAAGADKAPATTAPPAGGRKNPFKETRDIQQVIASIPGAPPEIAPTAPQQDLYAELYKPEPDTKTDDGSAAAGGGPAIPPMRVSAILQGAVTSAVLQIGSEFVQATPGKLIPDPTVGPYRVERIETGKVTLTRRWEQGARRGTQRFEVALGDGAPRPAGGFGGGPGRPGGFGGNGPGGPAGGNVPQ